jgi:hypothetical protein
MEEPLMTVRTALNAIVVLALAVSASPLPAQQTAATTPIVPVTVKNFTRAESDLYFGRTVKLGGFGKFYHYRTPTPIEEQEVVRMNRDTLYSAAVFDLDGGPITITLPDAGKRFMSLLIISEDHYAPLLVYAPGSFTMTKQQVGTRYIMAAIRTLADPNNPADVKAANALQDKILVKQGDIGKFEVPNWDPVSQGQIRDHLAALQTMSGATTEKRMGKKEEVDPILHLLATATGWGLNPPEAAVYNNVYPMANDGKTVHKLTVKDVPVDGFWSISVYNAKNFFEKNDLNSYSINNLTAKPNSDGSVTVQFGGCRKDTPNCLVTPAGWNYSVRQYRPRQAILDGTWKFPEAQPVR